MSGLIGFGPLDENQITYGASSFLDSLVFSIFAVGVLHIVYNGRRENY